MKEQYYQLKAQYEEVTGNYGELYRLYEETQKQLKDSEDAVMELFGNQLRAIFCQ